MTNDDDFDDFDDFEEDEAYRKAVRRNMEEERRAQRAQMGLEDDSDPRLAVWIMFVALSVPWYFFNGFDTSSVFSFNEKDILIGIFFMLIAMSFRR